ncbi:MAG: Crp/Fnr family transcriptional regulator [Cryomorphaceae bacterium]|nr:Crp/Fnr family transcriptional regulator [Cryomorphaceae bacterium]
MNAFITLLNALEAENIWTNTISLKRGEMLKRTGTVDTNLYFVDSGSLRIFIPEEEEELTIRFGYAGDFITALDCFISGKPSDMVIQAMKLTKVKVVPKNRYIQFIKDKKLGELWEEMLLTLVYQQMERERDLLTASPQKRFLRVLARSPRLFQEVPQKYIASYLRMTPETLSRMKKS